MHLHGALVFAAHIATTFAFERNLETIAKKKHAQRSIGEDPCRTCFAAVGAWNKLRGYATPSAAGPRGFAKKDGKHSTAGKCLWLAARPA